jgi:hypothetical protein
MGVKRGARTETGGREREVEKGGGGGRGENEKGKTGTKRGGLRKGSL